MSPTQFGRRIKIRDGAVLTGTGRLYLARRSVPWQGCLRLGAAKALPSGHALCGTAGDLDQSLGLGMLRLSEQGRGVGDLDDAAVRHDGDPIGHMLHDR